MATGIARMKTAPAPAPKPSPKNAPPIAARDKRPYYVAGVAISSGILLWMCFHPLALGTYLGWIALAPLFILVRSKMSLRVASLWAFLAGIVFFVPVLSWMRVADKSMAAAWIALSIYCAAYFPAALLCIRGLDRFRVPLFLSAPLVWVALEYFRCFALTGFPWYLLAHTQHDLLPMIQITDLGGVFIVSFVVVGVNAFLFDCAYQFPEVRQWFNQEEIEPYRYYASFELCNRGMLGEWLFRRNLLLEGTVLALVLFATYGYGVMRLEQDRFETGPTICLLQSNLDQRLRERASQGNSAEEVSTHFEHLIKRAALNQTPPPELLIWPETSFPGPWVEISPDYPIGKVPDKWRDTELVARDAMSVLAHTTRRIPNLVGVNAHRLDENGKHRRYNTALMVNGQGRIDAKFDKVHRVPFGEFLPFEFLRFLTPYEGDYGIQKGDTLTRFKVNKYHFGVLLCYEDSDPFMARQYLEETKDGPPVDFLVNMSNDGWFDGSNEHEEHLAVSRFRAIECRRTMVRAVNMGISAVIDSNGRVLKPTLYPGTNPPVWVVKEEKAKLPDLPQSDWHTFKKVAGIVRVSVPIDNRASFYVWAGDWLPMGCCLALVGIGGWALARRRTMRAQPA